jgi:hypothetical protein
MKFPWISRAAHEVVVESLQAQIAEMKEERRVLLDRLATIGLGGPLFHLPSQEVQSAQPEPDPEAAELAYIQSLGRTPSKLAAYWTKKAFRDAARPFGTPSVARIPDMSKMNEALDQAEQAGKKLG